MLISGSIIILFLFSMPAVLADQWDVLLADAQNKHYTALQIYKMGQEYMAVQYQKEILHFDYAKIQNYDKSFIPTDMTNNHPAKHIQNAIPIKFKTFP